MNNKYAIEAIKEVKELSKKINNNFNTIPIEDINNINSGLVNTMIENEIHDFTLNKTEGYYYTVNYIILLFGFFINLFFNQYLKNF